MSERRISELEHDTGQVLPCSWDYCPECREIKVTRITLSDAGREFLKTACTQRIDDPPLDMTAPAFWNRTTRRWWE